MKNEKCRIKNKKSINRTTLIPGIVFDTYESGVRFPLRAGYRFRYL